MGTPAQADFMLLGGKRMRRLCALKARAQASPA